MVRDRRCRQLQVSVTTSGSVKEVLNFRVVFNGSGSITAGGALSFRWSKSDQSGPLGVRTLMQVNHRRVIISATLLWAVLWFGETLIGVGAARINVGAEIITSTFCWLSASRPHRTTILITHRPQILEPFTILAPHPTTWAANSVGLQSYDKSWWSTMGVAD
jgi:hypothetical protein